jgi:hypothetical protein
MARKTPKTTTKTPAREEAPAESEERSIEKSTPEPERARTPAVPTGMRRNWLLTVFAFLVSTGLPWSCKASPIQWIASWASFPDLGDRALAMHATVPLLVLVAVASRETAPRVWARMSVASIAFFSMASLAVVAFGDALPTRPQMPGMPVYQDIPRVIRAYEGWARHVLRALLFVPPALVAGWALAKRGTDRAPLANRLMLGFLCAGLTLAWAPRRSEWGYWVGLVTSALVLALASRVDDQPQSLEPDKRNKVTAASVLWFVGLAALALTRARRA